MIKRQLTMLYEVYDKGPECDPDFGSICFNNWKELHMHLFEHGLYKSFQVFDDGKSVLQYVEVFKDDPSDKIYRLNWDKSVPGSVLFEIVNRHASAKL